MKSLVSLVLGLVVGCGAYAQAAFVPVGTPLNIIGDQKEFTVKTKNGPLVITRKMTACAKNGGSLQEVVPVAGVHPVGEIEILHALNDPEALVVDMRDSNDRVKGTIPGSIGIPYTEVVARMGELGCSKTGDKWNCDKAKKVYAFCNGPVCPQSPMAIKAMTREGFPAERIYYYRGGMLDWDALGFPSIKDEF
ncbi:rhodanese-related sulfurtransferase [Tibeticola sediminis]|uniref:Rhodanese-related sulfurtransferase n=1 Tax=Tibeticola sediminis TaxID=1917811 RepID=A0A3N4UA47_9BURK|nr:rhodanese-like domain-containing protein [Tibeticola sediminis]RPE67616.1 rhodanese-related sulfurtransferase [Tibeticola sediminis]